MSVDTLQKTTQASWNTGEWRYICFSHQKFNQTPRKFREFSEMTPKSRRNLQSWPNTRVRGKTSAIPRQGVTPPYHAPNFCYTTPHQTLCVWRPSSKMVRIWLPPLCLKYPGHPAGILEPVGWSVSAGLDPMVIIHHTITYKHVYTQINTWDSVPKTLDWLWICYSRTPEMDPLLRLLYL